MIACILSCFVLRFPPLQASEDLLEHHAAAHLLADHAGCVLGLAYLMNYSGATGTLGLAFAATGASFPFFSAILGWLGVFLPAPTPPPTRSSAICRW